MKLNAKNLHFQRGKNKINGKGKPNCKCNIILNGNLFYYNYKQRQVYI